MKRLNHIYVNMDGASRGNPGEAGVGIVIRDSNGSVIRTYKGYAGVRTNNVAEYLALKKALQLAGNYCRKRVTVLSDSELIVRQRKGLYKTRKRHLKILAKEVEALEQAFEHVEYRQVPREENKDADRLANQAIVHHRRRSEH